MEKRNKIEISLNQNLETTKIKRPKPLRNSSMRLFGCPLYTLFSRLIPIGKEELESLVRSKRDSKVHSKITRFHTKEFSCSRRRCGDYRVPVPMLLWAPRENWRHQHLLRHASLGIGWLSFWQRSWAKKTQGND